MKVLPEEKEKGKEEKKKDILAGSDDESDGNAEDLSKIQINEEYARRFEHNKRREALHRLEERKKQGHVADSDDEEDDEDESSSDDDDAAAIASRLVDNRVLKIISRIRSGDSAILDKGAKVFSSSDEDEDDGEEGPKEGKAKKQRPLYLKDVNAQHLLEEGPEFAAQSSRSSKHERIAYDERQREGLKEFLEAEKEALGGGDDNGEEDDLFVEKRKGGNGGDSEEDDEEEKQTEELAGQVFGKDEELDENEKFLKEYFLKRRYLESEKKNKFSLDDIQEVSKEQEFFEKQEQYEVGFKGYNFRHEEAEASGTMTDRVMGHPRIVEGSVRKKESSRKQQRRSKEERMAQAKQEQAEELKHLKNLKKKEIAEKLERIRMIAGIDNDAACKLGADDLEEDFDPEDYDRKMQEMFDDTYYGAEDVDPGFGSGDEFDLAKPDFDKEDELLGLTKGWANDGNEEGSTVADEKATRKKKKKGKELANGVELGEETKRKISLKDKVELEKQLEEYYKLDYEDTIGDLKTRFKYRQVKPNNFGLNTEEILLADDKDLNQYVSMKKLAPYREDEWKVTHHKKLSKDLILFGKSTEGKKVKTGKKSRSEGGPSTEDPENDKKSSKDGGQKEDRKKVKTGKNSRSEESPAGTEEPEKDLLTVEQDETDVQKSSRRDRKKRRDKELKVSDDRKQAYEEVQKEENKVRTRKKSRSEERPSTEETEKDQLTSEQDETDVKKKSSRSGRRKRREKELEMSYDRKLAYGKINPKRHKSN